MPLPTKPTFVTFDVYGTLIDWEKGIWDAFSAEADRDGFTIEREEVISLFMEIQREIEGGSYELYAEVLRRTVVEIAKRLGRSNRRAPASCPTPSSAGNRFARRASSSTRSPRSTKSA